MQMVSALYAEILQDTNHRKEVKLLVNGTEVPMSNIIELKTSGGLFESVGIGHSISRQISAQFVPVGEIPRMAEIRPYVRVRLDEHVSEWIPKGVFYIDTREADEASGTLTIHGYDAMLLYGGEPYLLEGDVGSWPRSAALVVADIAGRMGLELDPRTVIDPDVAVSFPNDWTLRETLGYIAAAHCGNWTITDAGKLRLVPLWSIPEYDPDEPGGEETSLLIDQHGDYITFGGVRIIV